MLGIFFLSTKLSTVVYSNEKDNRHLF